MKQDLATRADQPPQAGGLKATRGTFRFKNDLRNHCAIVQPRLYDSALNGYADHSSHVKGHSFRTEGAPPDLSVCVLALAFR